FRSVCGVGPHDAWPEPNIVRTNPTTDEVYLTPLFASGTTHNHNVHIFAAVAKQVADDFQDEACRPPGLTDSGTTWGIDTFTKMAKESFDGFKKQWKAANDEATRIRHEEQLLVNRRRGRRTMKANERKSEAATQEFAAEHNIDLDTLVDLMHEEHMSDEASGPEEGSGESFSNWKGRMASLAGYGDMPPAGLVKLNFLEVLGADWRSSKLSEVFTDVHAKWWDHLSPREKKNIKYIRVRDTGRSSTRIPKLAPFNFGLSKPWLDRHRFDPQYTTLLADWDNHKSPVGFR
ncbi:hypothetical protein B0H11DRAFT_1631203, partial [Mycena galericulata]